MMAVDAEGEVTPTVSDAPAEGADGAGGFVQQKAALQSGGRVERQVSTSGTSKTPEELKKEFDTHIELLLSNNKADKQTLDTAKGLVLQIMQELKGQAGAMEAKIQELSASKQEVEQCRQEHQATQKQLDTHKTASATCDSTLATCNSKLAALLKEAQSAKEQATTAQSTLTKAIADAGAS